MEEWNERPEEHFHSWSDDSEWQDRANLCAETLFLLLVKVRGVSQ